MIDTHLNDKSKTQHEDVQKRNTTIKKLMAEHLDASRYGTEYVVTYQGLPLTVANIAHMSMDERELVAEYLFKYFRSGGFPYPSYPEEELRAEWVKLQKFSTDKIKEDINGQHILSCGATVGSEIFKHFNPHFYHVTESGKNRKSMYEVFQNDDLLRKVIRNRLGITFFYRGESFPFTITGNMLKQGIRSMRLAPQISNFRISLAKYLYEALVPEQGIIYDYSQGFSQRLLGAMSSVKNFTYYATDPWQEQVTAGQKIIDFFNFNHRAFLNLGGSENYCPSHLHQLVDVALSSPPYFNKEVYTQDNTQAYAQGYQEFLHNYWKRTVQNCWTLLKPGGTMVINVSEKEKKFSLREDMCQIVEQAGFKFWDTWYMKFSKSHLSGKVGSEEVMKLEGIYLFKK